MSFHRSHNATHLTLDGRFLCHSCEQLAYSPDEMSFLSFKLCRVNDKEANSPLFVLREIFYCSVSNARPSMEVPEDNLGRLFGHVQTAQDVSSQQYPHSAQ